jgi:hypothetical protein
MEIETRSFSNADQSFRRSPFGRRARLGRGSAGQGPVAHGRDPYPRPAPRSQPYCGPVHCAAVQLAGAQLAGVASAAVQLWPVLLYCTVVQLAGSGSCTTVQYSGAGCSCQMRSCQLSMGAQLLSGQRRARRRTAPARPTSFARRAVHDSRKRASCARLRRPATAPWTTRARDEGRLSTGHAVKADCRLVTR